MIIPREFTRTRLYSSFQLYFLFQLLTASCFAETRLWSGRGRWGVVCPDAQTLWLRGLYHTDRRTSPGLPSFTAAGRWMWQPMLLSCSGARPAKPQADKECHAIVTTCTFMERGGRTSLAWTLTAYDETSSINQTIKGRAGKHLWNLWREPLRIYDQYQKRSGSKYMCLEHNCERKRDHFPNPATTSVSDALRLHISMIFPIWISHILSMNNSPRKLRFSN